MEASAMEHIIVIHAGSTKDTVPQDIRQQTDGTARTACMYTDICLQRLHSMYYTVTYACLLNMAS